VARFSHSIEVSQPPEVVFPWLLEENRVPHWTSHLEAYEHVGGGPIQQGSRVRQTIELSGSRVSVDIEVVRYEPPRGAEARFATNGVEVINLYALEPAGAGTRVTQSMDAKPQSLSARVLIPIVQPRLERKLTEDLERLRALLDGGG
jgi:Polyketide cyclase / dehydrase and lipid transport